MAPKRRTGRAKALALRAQAQRDVKKASRQKLRREAVKALNKLAEDLQLPVALVASTNAKSAKVEALVLKLEPRCQHGEFPVRLRAAVTQWRDNGGFLARNILPAESHADRDVLPAESNTVHEMPPAESSAEPLTQTCLVRHKVLEAGFILKSRAFMLTFNNRSWTRDTWGPFREWVKGLQPSFGFRAWAACLEVSEHAAGRRAVEVVHCHAYMYWTDGVGLYRRNLQDLTFDGVPPRVDVCTSTGRAFAAGACHGLWYVALSKRGTIFAETNYEAWQQYTPKEKWLTDLWAEQKLTHAQFLDLSAKFRHGHAGRRRDAMEVLMCEKRRAVRDHIKRERDLLQSSGHIKPRRAFPEVDRFIQLFTGPALRRPIFAIIGGTNTGKSMLGAAILQEVAAVLGLQDFLELTVEADKQMDLADFDLREHGGILLDGVGDALFLHEHREALQGRAKQCKEGKSATMMYSYPFTLCRRAVVATFDLAASNLALFQQHHWLSDPRNVHQLWLTGPAWQGEPTASIAAELQDGRATMNAWSVAQLSEFLEQHDLHGPAKHLRTNGVRGADLLGMDIRTLVSDVGLTRFAASRVISARDAFI